MLIFSKRTKMSLLLCSSLIISFDHTSNKAAKFHPLLLDSISDMDQLLPLSSLFGSGIRYVSSSSTPSSINPFLSPPSCNLLYIRQKIQICFLLYYIRIFYTYMHSRIRMTTVYGPDLSIELGGSKDGCLDFRNLRWDHD